MKALGRVTSSQLLLALLALAPAAAQDPDAAAQDPPGAMQDAPAAALRPAGPVPPAGSARASIADLLPAAIIGSGIGLAGGALVGAGTDIGGGDDPGLLGAFIFGVAGSALGTGLGIHLGSDREVPKSVAFATGTVGILAGVAFGAGLAMAFDVDGLLIGYVVGQGTLASALSDLLTHPDP